MGPSAVHLFGHVPHICQNWNVVLGIRIFVALFFGMSVYNIKVSVAIKEGSEQVR
jgi:hypothetical protein